MQGTGLKQFEPWARLTDRGAIMYILSIRLYVKNMPFSD